MGQLTRARVHASTPRIHGGAMDSLHPPPVFRDPRVGDGCSAPNPRFQGSTRVIRYTRGRWTGLSYYTQEPVLLHANKSHGKGTDTQINTRTSRLYDRIGPVGRFDENLSENNSMQAKSKGIVFAKGQSPAQELKEGLLIRL